MIIIEWSYANQIAALCVIVVVHQRSGLPAPVIDFLIVNMSILLASIEANRGGLAREATAEIFGQLSGQ